MVYLLKQKKSSKANSHALNEDLQRYQNQYYQVLNQANMRIVQVLSTSISQAAEKVAKDKKLGMVVNKEACFFFAPTLEVTADVITEMDKNYAAQEKAKETAAAEEAKAEKKAEAKVNSEATRSKDLAKLTGSHIVGDPDFVVSGVEALESAGSEDASFSARIRAIENK